MGSVQIFIEVLDPTIFKNIIFRLCIFFSLWWRLNKFFIFVTTADVYIHLLFLLLLLLLLLLIISIQFRRVFFSVFSVFYVFFLLFFFSFSFFRSLTFR